MMNEILRSQPFGYHKGKTIQALRYHFLARKEIKIMLIAVNVFAVFAAVLFFLFRISPLAFLICAFLWFILMLSCWFLLPAKLFRSSEMFRSTFSARFTDEELALEAEQGTARWPWSRFSHFLETPHFFHLYFNSRSFFLIPKEAFEVESLDKARRYLRRQISR